MKANLNEWIVSAGWDQAITAHCPSCCAWVDPVTAGDWPTFAELEQAADSHRCIISQEASDPVTVRSLR